MYLRLAALLVALASLACLSACEEQTAFGGQATSLQQAKNDGWVQFGPSQRLAGTELAVADVSAAMDDVVVSAQIAEVCQTKGCWMMVKDGEQELLVKFKNYSFFVPMNAAGHRAAMHGNIEVTPITVEALRKQAEAEGATPEEIAAITEPGERVVFMADAVYIEGEGLDEPYKPGDEIDMDGHEHLDAEGGEGGAMIEGGGCPGEDEGEGCGNCPDAENHAAMIEETPQKVSAEACSGEHEDGDACAGCEGETTTEGEACSAEAGACPLEAAKKQAELEKQAGTESGAAGEGCEGCAGCSGAEQEKEATEQKGG